MPNTHKLLKGNPRMLLNPSNKQFDPRAQGHTVRVDSEVLSKKLQSDLRYLKSLVPNLALFCDSDSIPGTHCPLNEVGKREEDSRVIMAIRGRTSYHLNLKEVRPMNLVRLRVHYVNVNEKSLLRIMKTQF